MLKHINNDENGMNGARSDEYGGQYEESRHQSSEYDLADDLKSQSSWMKMEDDKGNEYFYDEVTGHSQVGIIS